MSGDAPDLSQRLRQLAEDTIDQLNADALDGGAPVMLTSYVLVVEGNGWDTDGNPVSRGADVSMGSISQVKGLLVDTLDNLRREEP